MRKLLGKVLSFGRMIRFSHSVFALPFALSSAAIASEDRKIGVLTIVWIVVAMVGARSAAMGYNRLADQRIDALNPRTAGRELPRGVLTRGEVWAVVTLSSLVFVIAAGALNRLCLLLSPVALLLIFGYSYTKRFTSLSHLALGLCLGLAPVGAWLAVQGAFATVPLVIALGVLAWVAGFDVIYSCQDVEVDRREGLHSVPASLGVENALKVAAVLHALAVLAFASVYFLAALHPLYLAGVAVMAGLLLYEHALVSPKDLSKVNLAFFAVNGWVSVMYFVTTLAAVVYR